MSTATGDRVRLFDSLKARLFLAILVSAIPIVGGLGYYVWHQHNALINISQQAAENVVSTTAAYDKALVDNAREVLITLANSPVLRGGHWAECRGYLNTLLSRLPRYTNLGVIDLDGRLVCSGLADPSVEGTYLGDRGYFQAAVSQIDVALSGFTLGRISGRPTLVLAAPIPGYSGTNNGVVYLAFNLTYLRSGAAVPDLLPESELWVLDRQGHVLQRVPNNASDLGERVDPHPPGRQANLHTRSIDAQGRSWERFSMLAGPKGDLAGLSVRYEIPSDVLYADAKRALWGGILVIGLLLCIAGLAAWILIQLAAGRSLGHLREAVRRLAAQDFSWRVAGRLQGKELQQIGRQFDAMADTLQKYQHSLRQSEHSYRQLFQHSPDSMLVLSLTSGRFLAVNDQAVRQYGYDREAFLLLGLSDLRVNGQNHCPDSGMQHENHRRHDGQDLVVDMHNLPLHFAGQPARLLIIRDLTEQDALSRGLRERERLIGQLMDVTAEAICGLDPDGRILFSNQACASLLGYDDPDQTIGLEFHRLFHSQHEDGRPLGQADCRICVAMHKGQPDHVEDEVLWRRDGTSFPAEYWVYPILRDGQLDMCLVTFLDISERRGQQRALTWQATHDPLTGLLNRGEILRQLHQRVQSAPEVPWVYVMSNLDGFKEVNEALGHDAGDRLLQQVAIRFKDLLGESCVLARMGGDEFAFVLNQQEPQTALEQVQQLLAAIRKPYVLNELQVRISCSFGLVHYPDHASDPDDLVRFVDMTMRRAKRDGLGIAVFDMSDGNLARNRLLLRGELRAALDQGHFVLHLQPKIVLSGARPPGTPISFEALVRWQHPQHGLISPAQFIPIIEISDLVHPFTRWVVDQALTYCARMQTVAAGVAVAVNISARNLLDIHFADQIDQALKQHGLGAHLLELEVTESAIMADPNRAMETMHALDQLGVRLSVDDFGTGYSSFSYVKKLPISTLKIDQSFITGMAQDPDLQSIVRSMIDMAHTLGLSVVAEGIETADVQRQLRAMGCDGGQGYFIGRPAPLEEALVWLQHQVREL